MNANLEKVLDFIVTNLQTSKDFILDQAPDVIQQMLLHDLLSRLTPFILVLGFGIVIIIAALYLKHNSKKDDFDCEDKARDVMTIIVLGIFSIMFIVSLCCASTNTVKILQIKLTPKAYLINKVIDLRR